MTPRQPQEPPTPIRFPKEWKPEIANAAERRGISPHAFVLKAVRRVLDGEKRKR